MGTIRYTSINSHLSIEQSRRDDMESLGYILIYLAKSKLPWQGLIFFDEEMRMRRIAELKCSIKVEKLAEGLPKAFEQYLRHAKNLKFTERPDYDYLRKLFNDTASQMEVNLNEHCFEWQSKSKTKKSKLGNKKSSLKGGRSEAEFMKKSNLNGKEEEKMKTINHLGDAKPMGDIKNMPFSSNQLKIPQRLKDDNVNFSSNMISYESNPSKGIPFSQKVLDDDESGNSRDRIPEEASFEFENGLGKVKVRSDDEAELARKKKRITSKKSSIFKKMGGGTMKEDGFEDDDDESRSVHSEDFSHDIMDEKTSNIQKKIDLTTLTKRYFFLFYF